MEMLKVIAASNSSLIFVSFSKAQYGYQDYRESYSLSLLH